MAKRRAASVRTAPAGSPIIVTTQAAPVQRRTRRTGIKRRKSGKRRRSSGIGGGMGASGFLNSERVGAMVGGFLLGVLDKQGTTFPTLPVLGRAGTMGVALYFAGKQFHMPILVHSSTAALAIATYELGKDGKIAGVEGFDSI